jgi:hypothetical protein
MLDIGWRNLASVQARISKNAGNQTRARFNIGKMIFQAMLVPGIPLTIWLDLKYT